MIQSIMAAVNSNHSIVFLPFVWQSAWRIASDRIIISIVFTASGCQKMALTGHQAGPLRIHPGHWLLERRSVGNVRNVKKATRKPREGQDGAFYEGLEGDQAGDVHCDHSQDLALCRGKNMVPFIIFSAHFARQSSRLRRKECISPNTKLCQR